jgi:hypothetical protein
LQATKRIQEVPPGTSNSESALSTPSTRRNVNN